MLEISISECCRPYKQCPMYNTKIDLNQQQIEQQIRSVEGQKYFLQLHIGRDPVVLKIYILRCLDFFKILISSPSIEQLVRCLSCSTNEELTFSSPPCSLVRDNAC